MFFNWLRRSIGTAKYVYRCKHRFDKSPTAKCYCIDCTYYNRETGRCNAFANCYVYDDCFCWRAEIKKKR